MIQIACAKDMRANPPITLYNYDYVVLIDKGFSGLQRKEIYQALAAWERASQHRVKFYPVWNQTKPQSVDASEYGDVLFIWNLKDKDQKMLEKGIKKYSSYSGYFLTGDTNESGHILMFVEEDELFYGVMLHELGHFLGLSHIEDENTVMYGNVGSVCITKKDAKALCDIIDCKPTPEC